MFASDNFSELTNVIHEETGIFLAFKLKGFPFIPRKHKDFPVNLTEPFPLSAVTGIVKSNVGSNPLCFPVGHSNQLSCHQL